MGCRKQQPCAGGHGISWHMGRFVAVRVSRVLARGDFQGLEVCGAIPGLWMLWHGVTQNRVYLDANSGELGSEGKYGTPETAWLGTANYKRHDTIEATMANNSSPPHRARAGRASILF